MAIANVTQQEKSQLVLIVTEVDGQCDLLLCDPAGKVMLFERESPFIKTLPSSCKKITEQPIEESAHAAISLLMIAGAPQLFDYQWCALRPQLDRVDEATFTLAGRALQIGRWYLDHQFCGRCGIPTLIDTADRARYCQSCSLRFYPRISPCMIVLVTRGDHLLLAHHARASRKVFSTLAGFVEPGETVEATVHREVMEEVGVCVTNLRYIRSQAWPFPAQLMMGYIAEYTSGDISVDQNEILEANWYHYDNLPEIPSERSVAGQLIAHYIQERKQQI